jgi:hypothetical protein
MSLRRLIAARGRLVRHGRRVLRQAWLTWQRDRVYRGSKPSLCGDAVVLAVYRRVNAATLKLLLSQAGPAVGDVRLWALDDAHPDLVEWTVGSGPGMKFELLNKLLDVSEIPTGVAIVVVDDDVVFRRGNLAVLLRTMARAGFGLAQPAHSRISLATYSFNKVHLFARARRTTFVEIGPLFVVAPKCRNEFLPFPAEFGMGWGLELEWARRMDHCPLGVVDAATVVHLVPPNAFYRVAQEDERLHELLYAAGKRTIADAQRELGVWRRWQRDPPWATGLESAEPS